MYQSLSPPLSLSQPTFKHVYLSLLLLPWQGMSLRGCGSLCPGRLCCQCLSLPPPPLTPSHPHLPPVSLHQSTQGQDVR